MSCKSNSIDCRCLIILSIVLLLINGCVREPLSPIDEELYPSGSVYIYQPLNPMTIWLQDPADEDIKDGYEEVDPASEEFRQAVLRDLDTEIVRISLTDFQGNVDIKSGIVGTSVKGKSYILIVDYMKYFASTKQVMAEYPVNDICKEKDFECFEGNVPIYTGIGLRVRAEFKALQSGLDISGLPAIAVAANSKGISGRLTVQTFGISGPEITALMPIISDISVASIQSSIQSLAAIKAKIYEDSTRIYPKLIGFESPSKSPRIIHAITAELYNMELGITPVAKQVDPDDPDSRQVWISWDLEDINALDEDEGDEGIEDDALEPDDDSDEEVTEPDEEGS